MPTCLYNYGITFCNRNYKIRGLKTQQEKFCVMFQTYPTLIMKTNNYLVVVTYILYNFVITSNYAH